MGALSGILPVLMLRKSVALGELECVVFGDSAQYSQCVDTSDL